VQFYRQLIIQRQAGWIQQSGIIARLPLDEGLITPSQELLPGWPVPPIDGSDSGSASIGGTGQPGSNSWLGVINPSSSGKRAMAFAIWSVVHAPVLRLPRRDDCSS
jgi:hypothetical protein